MCKKLIQIYACGHTKTICTTACPHAIETGRQVPQVDGDNGIMRSISSASTLVAPPRESTPAHLRSPTAPRPSIEAPQTPRALLPNQPRSSLERPNVSPTSPTNSTSPAPTLTTSPSIFNLASNATTNEIEIEPNFCPYYFPHNLPQSNHPCIDCCLLPEWEHRVKRYMQWYKNDHPLGKVEDVERLSGVEYLKEKQGYKELREREGKLNVFLDGDEGAGWVG